MAMDMTHTENRLNYPLFWFELAGVSWSEFVAGTHQAQPLKPLRICSFAEYLYRLLRLIAHRE